MIIVLLVDTSSQQASAAQDLAWMKRVLALAASVDPEEVPVTGLLTHQNKLIATATNDRHRKQDPFGHVEVSLIEQASQKLATWRLTETVLYVSIEPCLLCTGAIYAARIPRVVFGAPSPKGGALAYVQKHEQALGLNHHVDCVGGVLADEAAALMKSFFQNKRQKS